jgi:hypothetical protein
LLKHIRINFLPLKIKHAQPEVQMNKLDLIEQLHTKFDITEAEAVQSPEKGIYAKA